MKDSSTKEPNASSPTKGSRRRPITRFTPLQTDGCAPLPSAGHSGYRYGSAVPEPVGTMFGRWKLLSQEILRRAEDYNIYVNVRCTCGHEQWTNYRMMKKGKSQGCVRCRQELRKSGAPNWLMKRMGAAMARCTNPNDPGWKWYGARGVEFRFRTAGEAAVWVMENLGLDRSKQIDRCDNSGHYEPGNIRYVTSSQNNSNKRNNVCPKDFVFIAEDWPYGEFKVRQFLGEGMTREQILGRAQQSVVQKRKGWKRMAEWFASTTCSMQAPGTASA